MAKRGAHPGLSRRQVVRSLLDMHPDHSPEKEREAVDEILANYDDLVDVAAETGSRFLCDKGGVLRWQHDPLVLKLYERFVGDRKLREVHGGVQGLWDAMEAREAGALTERELRRLYRAIGYTLCGYAEIWNESRGGVAEPPGED